MEERRWWCNSASQTHWIVRDLRNSLVIINFSDRYITYGDTFLLSELPSICCQTSAIFSGMRSSTISHHHHLRTEKFFNHDPNSFNRYHKNKKWENPLQKKWERGSSELSVHLIQWSPFQKVNKTRWKTKEEEKKTTNGNKSPMIFSNRNVIAYS